MSNLMSDFKLMNKPSRNGFDLTTRNSFSAKIGELLPVLCTECLPGDKFKINLSHFSRTQPLASPAYVRIKEYYDFIFVPTRLLWRYFDQFINQMPNNLAASSSTSEVFKLSRHPYFSRDAIARLLNTYADAGKKDDIGYNAIDTSAKLLNYLDYGNCDSQPNVDYYVNNALNAFPILAYQKAYCDIYRFDQWESPEPHTFNVDYMVNSQSMEISLNDIEEDIPLHDFFSMRYANYPKDLFMGVLPNSQFGDVSIVNSFNSIASPGNPACIVQRVDGTLGWSTNGTPSSVGNTVIDGSFNFSILALRQAEFLQKWKEVSQTAKQDYRDQIKAHWNVDVSKARANVCEYLGGCSSNVQISGEVNTNLSDGTTLIKGTALSASRGEIDYDVPEHGILLCIYHASPLLDYNADVMVAPLNFKTMPTDYAILEMDKTGMQLVPNTWLFGNNVTPFNDNYNGYAPRYIDYKTNIDRVHGAFNNGFKNWVAPFNPYRGQIQQVTYDYFKIDAAIYSDVFGVVPTGSVNTDQLFCNANFDIKAVRNLDVNGMPY